MKYLGVAWVPLGILYYSVLLAAVIFERGHWGEAWWRGLLFYPFLMLGYLFFARFRVVQRTYRPWAAISLGLFAGSVLLRLLLREPLRALEMPYDPFYDGVYFGYLPSTLLDMLKLVHKYALPWLPLVLLVWALRQGFRRRCPKCPAVDGLYARRVMRREDLGTSSYQSTETTVTYDTRTTYSGTHTVETRTTTPVTRYYRSWRLHCECAVCQHAWTTIETT